MSETLYMGISTQNIERERDREHNKQDQTTGENIIDVIRQKVTTISYWWCRTHNTVPHYHVPVLLGHTISWHNIPSSLLGGREIALCLGLSQ